MGRSFRIGKIFGIPLMLDFTFFLIFLFIIVTLSTNVFPSLDEKGEWPTSYYWIVGIATSLLCFASLIAHETAHSIVSKRAGIPVISITLFLLGGVAQISKEITKPKTELVMALAGPLCSAALSGIFFGLSYIFDGVNVYLSALCFYIFYWNLILAAFNMIPGFPMDGGRVLRSIVWMVKKDYVQATRIAVSVGFVAFIGFILYGIWLIAYNNLLGGGMFIFMGFYLIISARANYQQLLMRDNLKGIYAQDIMIRELPRIPRNLNIMDLIDGVLLQSTQQSFFVTDGENIVGVLTTWQVKRVPQKQRSLTTVAQVMIPIEAMKTVLPTDTALLVLAAMEQSPDNLVAVTYNAQVIGIISRESIFGFAQRRQIFRGRA